MRTAEQGGGVRMPPTLAPRITNPGCHVSVEAQHAYGGGGEDMIPC
jgi:hypothetical protein